MERFEDAQSLTIIELRHALAAGDATEAVWAAWELGLRLGLAAASDILASSEIAKDAGLRRHLCILLAGQGEWPALQIIATSDRDDLVRASAARCLALAARVIPALRDFVKTLFPSASVAVCEAILATHSIEHPLFSEDELLDLLKDHRSEIRQSAFQKLTSSAAASYLYAGRFANVLHLEADPDIFDMFLKHALENGAYNTILDQAALSSGPRQHTLLMALIREEYRFPWIKLAPFAITSQSPFELWDNELDAESAPWVLSQAILYTSSNQAQSSHEWFWFFIGRISQVLSLCGEESFSQADREIVAQFFSRIIADLKIGIDEGWTDPRELDPGLEGMEAALRQIRGVQAAL